ncbi:MAG: hypothetical protein VB101_11755 [Rhodospirillaceae bacterium]|nr:hypothetical protein [Rhodospirillaceae bacterium]MEA4838947.1 hypothetical protein [Rhodospirillaceae bacterium]
MKKSTVTIYSYALRSALDQVERMNQVSRGDMAMVPTRPSDDMINAGVCAGHISETIADSVYRAMVRAAQH